MDKLIHITAAYSSTLLVLAVSMASDFAKEPDPPVPETVTLARPKIYLRTNAPQRFPSNSKSSPSAIRTNFFGTDERNMVKPSVRDNGLDSMSDAKGARDANKTDRRNPKAGSVQLLGLTNGTTLSGIVAIRVVINNSPGPLDNLALTEDGSPVSGISIASAPFQPPLFLLMDTTQMSNGVHHIVASASWLVYGRSEGPTVDGDSPPITINVYNEISFPMWMPSFGQRSNSLLVAAQSGHKNVDWDVDIYDSKAQYVGTLSGHTDNGLIEAVWDLTGPDGQIRTDNQFQFVISTTWTKTEAPGSDPPTNTPHK